jgi:hypothetical protein
MNFSVSNTKIYAQAMQAFENFEKHTIPFAAVKLSVSMQNVDRKKVDEIVEDNFRSENDLIFKNKLAYFILMKDTPIHAAESAASRLKVKLGELPRHCIGLKDDQHIHASAFILGSIPGTNRLHVRYLDLSPAFDFKKRNNRVPFIFKEYLKCGKLPENDHSKFSQMINLIV